MAVHDIRNIVLQALAENQGFSGRAVPEMDDDTRPIGDLDGFDSLNATEVAIMLSGALSCRIPTKVMLARVNGELPQVRDIVARLHDIVSPKGGEGNESDR